MHIQIHTLMQIHIQKSYNYSCQEINREKTEVTPLQHLKKLHLLSYMLSGDQHKGPIIVGPDPKR